MKKLVFSMLAMAAMVSCTSESDPINDITNGDKVEIKLNAGFGISTKAPITSDEATGILDNALTGIQFIQAPNAASAVWTGVDGIASTADIKTADIGTGAITFNTTLYYDANTNLKSHLIGYYPACDANFPSETNKGKLQWTFDGSKDILLSDECSGNKKSGEQITDITFKHQLIQLQFNFTAENTDVVSAWGNITEIKIKKQGASGLENLNTVLSCTLPGTLQFNIPGDLTVRKVETDGTYSDDKLTNLTLSTTKTLGGYIMVEALASATDYYLEITTEKGTAQTQLTLGGAPKEGNAYDVELTFKATSIEPTAKITSWKAVTGGTGTVE